MTWSVIRKATEKDIEELDLFARRFAKRHDIPINETERAYDEVDLYIVIKLDNAPVGDWERPELKRLETLWKRCIRRALHEPAADGIAWGTIGFHVQ